MNDLMDWRVGLVAGVGVGVGCFFGYLVYIGRGCESARLLRDVLFLFWWVGVGLDGFPRLFRAFEGRLCAS